MTSDGSRPSADGCTGYSPFEQELVNAMNDYAKTSDTPRFDTAVIARGARRKRITAIAGVSAALIMAGGGTALAAGAVGGTHNAATSHATTAGKNATTLVWAGEDGAVHTVSLAGRNESYTRVLLAKYKLVSQFANATVPHCTPGTVIAVSQDAPTVFRVGGTPTIFHVGRTPTTFRVGGTPTIFHVGGSGTIFHVGDTVHVTLCAS